MIKKFKRLIGRHWMNAYGWRTNRRIVVIESDDWGAVRMPSKRSYDELTALGVSFLDEFDRYDSLATEEDFDALYGILTRYRDMHGHHPIVTAMTVVANPDFAKIAASDFQEYFYEPFTETLSRYVGCEHSFDMWKQGMGTGVFHPEFHAREHVNVERWLKCLRSGHHEMRLAFDKGAFCAYDGDNTYRHHLFCTNDYQDVKGRERSLDGIREGISLFESIFGYKPRSYMAPAYCWSIIIEDELKTQGIDYIQSGLYQMFPSMSQQRSTRHKMGQINAKGQLYTFRNCSFEPSVYPHLNHIKRCLENIKIAFFWGKPAIISIHRVNFIGSIDVRNRNKNLELLDCLLKEILKEYPNVEFMTSTQLADEIAST